MELVSLGLLAVITGISLFNLIRQKNAYSALQAEMEKTLQGGLQSSLSKNAIDLSATITRTTSDIRQDMSDRLNERFTAITKDLKEDLRSGREEMRNGLSQTTVSLESKFTALEGKVNERLETIGKEVQQKLDKNIQDGFAHFQKVQETLANAEKQLQNLNAVGQSVQELNNVLNLPHLRGKIIGEGNLERLLADFLPSGYYEMQFEIEKAYVDAVIKFTHLNLVLPIDSKFSMEQVAPLFDHSAQPEELKAARKKLSEVVRQNARDIKTKYIKPRLGTTDYALMYLPSETLYFEVVRDTALWEAIVELKVFPVSPNTLAITVNSIGKSLQYYEMAKGVKKTISQIQLARDHLSKFRGRFDEIGEKLTKAQESFQKASTHLSNYSSSVDRLESPDAILELSETAPTKNRPPLALELEPLPEA